MATFALRSRVLCNIIISGGFKKDVEDLVCLCCGLFSLHDCLAWCINIQSVETKEKGEE